MISKSVLHLGVVNELSEVVANGIGANDNDGLGGVVEVDVGGLERLDESGEGGTGGPTAEETLFADEAASVEKRVLVVGLDPRVNGILVENIEPG